MKKKLWFWVGALFLIAALGIYSGVIRFHVVLKKRPPEAGETVPGSAEPGSAGPGSTESGSAGAVKSEVDEPGSADGSPADE